MSLPCFVVNLEDSPENFEKQKPFLVEAGLNPIRFIGVDARKDEHLDYMENVSSLCALTCPKTVMGCGLSHILLAQHLKDIGVPLALVLEDDAFPKVSQLLKHVQIALNEVPEDWDILKLHCSFCKDDTINSKGGSTAAYLINSRGIQKLSNLLLNFHIDVQLNVNEKIKIYKSKYNLFWTDEISSTNRGSNSRWLDMRGDLSGETTLSQGMTYKIFKIPGTAIEFETWQILIILLLLFLLFQCIRRT